MNGDQLRSYNTHKLRIEKIMKFMADGKSHNVRSIVAHCDGIDYEPVRKTIAKLVRENKLRKVCHGVYKLIR